MKRRHFVLFEILIAFALVSLSIFPFLHYPFEHMRKEIDLLYEMELEKLAQSELINLQVQLYKKEISQSKLFGKEGGKIEMCIGEEVKVEPFSGWSKSYIKKVSIEQTKQKIGEDKTETVLLHLEVQFIDQKKKETALIAASDIVVQKKGIR